MGTLYLVATPIGNLEDISARALRVLREARLIAAEDTRQTRKLLEHYGIPTPATSYHEHNKLTKLDRILEALREGDVALVSDAGTPGLSDPGFELIQAALQAGIRVVPLPGPSAVIAALVASGLPTDSFTYLGFLPRKSKARREVLAGVREAPQTLVAYEAPHRLVEALEDVKAVLGDRPVAVARELTKLHEEIWRGPVEGALAHYAENPPRGEITLVIGGAATVAPREWAEDDVRAALAERLAAGEPRSAAAKAVARESGWTKSEVYDLDV